MGYRVEQSGQKKGIARGGGKGTASMLRLLFTPGRPLLDEALQSGVQFGPELLKPKLELWAPLGPLLGLEGPCVPVVVDRSRKSRRQWAKFEPNEGVG